MREIPSQTEVKEFTARFDDLAPFVFDYARRKHLTEKIEQNYDEFDDVWKRYPDDWENVCMAMLIVHTVLGSGKRTAAFIRSLKKDLPDDLLTMVRYWRGSPWFFSAFRVVREIGNDFLEIDFIGDPPETCRKGFPAVRFLYSPGVTENFRDGKTFFLALLYHNSEVLFTYGVIIPFLGIDEKDLYYFADIDWHRDISLLEVPVFGINDRSTDLTDTIAEDPLSFLRLFEFSQRPAVQSRDGAVEKCVSAIDFDAHLLPKDEKKLKTLFSASGEIVNRIVVNEYGIGIFFGTGRGMYDPVLYFSFDGSPALLSALTMKAYQRGQKAASGICSFPQYPDIHASMTMVVAAQEILDYEDMLTIMEKLIGDDAETGEKGSLSGEELDEINAVARRITDNYNRGIEEDDDTLASDLGVPAEMVASLRERIFKSDAFTDMGPAADRYGLPPQAFHVLTNGGVPRAEGYLVLRSADEISQAIRDRNLLEVDVFSTVPVMRFAQWMLTRAVQPGSIPATQAGYVGTKVIKDALEKKLLPTAVDYITRFSPEKQMDGKFYDSFLPKKERDWKDFLMFRQLLEKADLLHLKKNKFVPAARVEELLSAPAELYHHLAEIMFTSFRWDQSERLGTVPYIHSMAGFLFYVLDRLSLENDGAWFDSRDLTKKFMYAVPPVREEYEEEMEHGTSSFTTGFFFKHGINSRFIDNFALPFGLAESRSISDYETELRRPDFFSMVFKK